MPHRNWSERVDDELARRGVPARFRRRLLAELRDHADDLTDGEGLTMTDDELNARLGDPEILAAQAAEEYRRTRWTSRHPLLMFRASATSGDTAGVHGHCATVRVGGLRPRLGTGGRCGQSPPSRAGRLHLRSGVGRAVRAVRRPGRPLFPVVPAEPSEPVVVRRGRGPDPSRGRVDHLADQLQ